MPQVEEPLPLDKPRNQALSVILSPVKVASAPVSFFAALRMEMRLLLKGWAWWWYLPAVGVIGASLIAPLDIVSQYVLPAGLILPLLIWSGLGSHETRWNTRQLVFSAPQPLLRQVGAAWLAGFAVAFLMAGGSIFRFALAGQLLHVCALFSALLFIPSLALALGIWTGSSKPFEVIYVLLWYLGVLNKVLELDYAGIHQPQNWWFYLSVGALLFLAAVLGRKRQLQR